MTDNLLNKYKLENYLFDRLFTHISLELKFENGKGLDPRFSFYNSIYESLGKFDNAGKVVSHIIKELKNNFNSQIIDCSKDNVFFNKISIEINNEHNGSMSYIKYANDIIYVNLYSSNIDDFLININEYEKLMLHELLHGYEDFNRIKNGKDSIFDLVDKSYTNAFRNINNGNDLYMYLSQCKYFLNAQERNAYFTSLESSIKKLLNSGNYTLDKFDYKKFKNDLKNTDIWKIYFDLFIFIENLKTLSENKDIIKKVYYNLFKEEKTFKEIYNELIYKWEKFNSKFNQLVPKILCNNINIKENREFSFFINKINKYFEL